MSLAPNASPALNAAPARRRKRAWQQTSQASTDLTRHVLLSGTIVALVSGLICEIIVVRDTTFAASAQGRASAC